MSVKWIVRMLVVALIVLIFIAAGGQAVLHLWNWLMPSLFGWHELTFWRAVGLLALCRILFGSFGGRPMWRSNFRRRMGERWDKMTPEERDRFKRGIPSPCGGVIPPDEAKQKA